METPSRAGWMLASLLAACAAAPTPAAIWQGQAEIEFQATSTLHDFSGTARTEPFTVLATPDGAIATLGGTATVAVAQMVTRHAKRDENMRKMFEAQRFPLVAGVVEPIRFDPASQPQIPLLLTIRGRTQTVPAILENWRMEKNRLRFELSMTLSLRKSGLSPPVLFGLIRVGDAVSVRVRAELEKSTRPAPL